MQRKRRQNEYGFSLVELMVVMAIILIILSIAIPRMISAHNYASEVVVVREIQTIHQAQMQYLSQFGRYAATLAELGPPTSGAAGPHAAHLIPVI